MMTAVKKLTPEARAALRRHVPQAEGTRWVTDLAAKRGWEEANRSYLESTRAQGVEEMSALMEDLGISAVASREEALELLETALAVYLPEAQVERMTDDRGEPALRIGVRECPTYAASEASGWHGVTACSFWHRRQGWYQALGIDVMDTVVGEKKWGDVACAALVQLPAAAPGRERNGN